MSAEFAAIVTTREAAHAAAMGAYRQAQVLLQDGLRVRISAAEDQDDISIRQRKFLHGPVLAQISEQVRVEGERYVAAIWKTYFRNLFIGDRWVVRKVPRWDAVAGKLIVPKRGTPHRERISTEDLSVKQYSEFIDKVIAHAATEFGVAFVFDADERDGVRYVRPARKVREAVAA